MHGPLLDIADEPSLPLLVQFTSSGRILVAVQPRTVDMARQSMTGTLKLNLDTEASLTRTHLGRSSLMASLHGVGASMSPTKRAMLCQSTT